jgi:hypothetical protein
VNVKLIAILLALSSLANAQIAEMKPVHLSREQIQKRIVEREFSNVPPGVKSFHARGAILVLIEVNRLGEVTRARAVNFRGFGFLTEYVEKTISDWKFRALKQNGNAVPFRGVLPVEFWYGSFPEKAPY